MPHIEQADGGEKEYAFYSSLFQFPFLTQQWLIALGKDSSKEGVVQKSVERILPPEAINTPEPIIAVVGPIAAGKGTAVNILLEAGFIAFNYGDIIGEERRKLGLPEERKNSNFVGAKLRSEFGKEVIAQRIGQEILRLKELQPRAKVLIDGLRHPAEVLWVKEHLGVKIIGITASLDLRFQRSLKRNRAVDPKSRSEFKEVDGIDRGILSNEYQNQSDACLALADFVIDNDGEDIQVYTAKIKEILRTLGVKLE